MKKILLSLGSIIFAGALVAGGTGAFLGDRETSSGNTFASGVIDLKIDNESYVTNDLGKLVFSPTTSWSLSGLAGKLFFNFPDIKPGDIGEDTISLHINNNNAWACMAVTMTGTPENGQNDPEALVDTTAGLQQGELQNKLYFAFWADDGDNVYEKNETIFKEGLVKDIWNGDTWKLADSTGNIWGGNSPIAGGSTKYIGKAWCYGDITKAPVNQDNQGKTGSNGPLVRGTGFTCNGAELGNLYQSDGITADVMFEATQSRSNDGFKCSGGGSNPNPEEFTLFFDDFESCLLNTNFHSSWQSKWTEVGGAQAATVGEGHGKAADLEAGVNQGEPSNIESITSKSIDMTIYHDITLSYDRKTDDTSGPVTAQTLKVEYSTNGGSSWTTLESVSGETPWTTKSFTLSPSADHKPSVKIRFTLTGTDSTNHAFIDNVKITGFTP